MSLLFDLPNTAHLRSKLQTVLQITNALSIHRETQDSTRLFLPSHLELDIMGSIWYRKREIHSQKTWSLFSAYALHQGKNEKYWITCKHPAKLFPYHCTFIALGSNIHNDPKLMRLVRLVPLRAIFTFFQARGSNQTRTKLSTPITHCLSTRGSATNPVSEATSCSTMLWKPKAAAWPL